MRSAILVLLAFISGCVSAPTPKSNLEQIALDTANDPRPSCEPGHEGALANRAITIRPGEVICFNVRSEGNTLIPTEIVSTDAPERAVVLKLWLDPTTGDAVLTVHNPLSAFLRYQAYMFRPGATQREYTSSCPVLSKRMSLEHWPYPIAALTLSHFTTEPESKSITCK